MKEGLVDLLGRKTERAQAEAGNAVQRLSQALKEVVKAEQMGVYEIHLPPALANGPTALSEQLPQAGYLALLGITDTARKARLEVAALAMQQAEHALGERQRAERRAELAVSNAKTSHEHDLHRAQDHERSAQTAANGLAPDFPSERIGQAAGIGCLTQVMVLALASAGALNDSSDVQVAIGYVFGYFGFATVPFLVVLWYVVALAISGSRGAAEIRKGKADRSSAEAQAKATYAAEAPRLVEQRANAKSRRQQAEAALDHLKRAL